MVKQTRRTAANARDGFLPQARFQQPTATVDSHSQPPTIKSHPGGRRFEPG